MQTSYQHGPQIVERFMSRGPSGAVYPSLWDSSLVLATLAQPWGGTQARDFSRRNNHGTLTNGPTWGYGVYRGGVFRQLSLTAASSQYVDLGSKNFGSDIISVCGWVNWATYSASRPIIARDGGTWWLGQAATSGLYRFLIYGGTPAADHTVDTTTSTSAGQWNHVAATWDRTEGTMRIYLNGALDNTTADKTFARAFSGTHRIGSNNALYFDGGLADVRLYQRVLSTPEIRQLAQHPLAAYETRINRYWMFTSGLADPFAIDNSGVITIADNSQLSIGDTWEVVIEVTDSDANTSQDTFLIELLEALELEGAATLAITAGGSLSFLSKVTGSATLTIDASATVSIDALLAAAASLEIAATGSLTFLVGLTGASAVVVDAAGSLTALVSLAGAGALVIDASGRLEGVVFVGAPDDRVVTVEAETRIVIVDAENRIVEV